MDVLCDGEQVKVSVVDGEVDAEEPGSAVDPDQLLQLLEDGGRLVLQGAQHLKHIKFDFFPPRMNESRKGEVTPEGRIPECGPGTKLS